jgi:hypothetical protein
VPDNRKLLLSPDWKLAFEDRHVLNKELAIRQHMEKLKPDGDASEMVHNHGRLVGQLEMLKFLRETLPNRLQREIEEEERVELSTSASLTTVSPEIL